MSWWVLGPVRSHISAMEKFREAHAAERTGEAVGCGGR